MLLRPCERRKNGKSRTDGALVASYRTAPGSRQRVVGCLGERKPTEQDGWARLGAQRLSGRVTRKEIEEFLEFIAIDSQG